MSEPRSTLDRRRVRRHVIWGALAAALAAGIALALALGGTRPLVEIAAVRRGTYVRYVEEDGRTRVRDRYVVSAPLAGTLQRLALRVGDSVAAGDVVAVVNPLLSPLLDARSRSALEQQLGAAEARLAATRATRERVAASRLQAEKELVRARVLAQAGALAAHGLEIAEATLTIETHAREAAAHAVHLAEHELEQARAALQSGSTGTSSSFVLRAPVSGRVLQVLQTSETVVAPGSPVLEIGDPRVLEVVVDLLTTDAVSVELGMSAEITGWGGGGTVRGIVTSVEPVAVVRVSALGVEEERADVVIQPVDRGGSWTRVGHGYRVDVRIPVERTERALLVPTSALFREGEHWKVFVITGGVARSARAVVSSYGPRNSVVAEGLRAGDEVVLQPPESLRDGTRVALSRGAR